jgi:hypothetical protein
MKPRTPCVPAAAAPAVIAATLPAFLSAISLNTSLAACLPPLS